MQKQNKHDILFYCDGEASTADDKCAGWAVTIKTENKDVQEVIKKNVKAFQIATFHNIKVDDVVKSGIGRCGSESDSSAGRMVLLSIKEALEICYLIQGKIAPDLNVQIIVPEPYLNLLNNKFPMWAKGDFVKPDNHNKLARMIYGSFECLKRICKISYNIRQNFETKFTKTVAQITADFEQQNAKS